MIDSNSLFSQSVNAFAGGFDRLPTVVTAPLRAVFSIVIAFKTLFTFLLLLLALPFVGVAPFIFWALYKGAEGASHLVLARGASSGKRKCPLGISLLLMIAVGLGVYAMWPASVDQVGVTGLGVKGIFGMVVGFFAGNMANVGTSFGLVAMGAVLVLIILGFTAGPYLFGNSETFARDAESLFRLSGAGKLGGVARQIGREIDEVLDGMKGETRGAKMANLVHLEFSKHADPLLRGDVKLYAQTRFPWDSKWRVSGNLKNIELHERLHPSLVRSHVIDGILLTGDEPAELAKLNLKSEHVERAYDAVFNTAMPAEGATALTGLFLAASAFFAVATGLANLTHAGWFMLFPCLAVAGAAAYAAWQWHAASTVARIAVAALRPSSIRPIVNRIVNARPDLLMSYKDSIVRRSERLDEIRDTIEQWRKQIQIADRDKFKHIIFGYATGSALFRGSLSGMLEGQAASLTPGDASRGGIAIVAPTGAGKSHASLGPVMAQLMDQDLDQVEDAELLKVLSSTDIVEAEATVLAAA